MKNPLTQWLVKQSYISILAIFAIIFFIFYSTLAFYTPGLFNSPDEKANFFFTSLYVETGSFSVYEPLNNIASGLVHPRSTGVINDFILPGSFIGLILFVSFFAKLFGLMAIQLVIPLLSSITPIFFYLLIKRVFNSKIGFISALLLYLQPAFWYYSTRSLYPNILFVDLLIIGFCCLVYINKTYFVPSFLLIALSGLSIGFAIGVRASESIWVLISLFLMLIFLRKKFSLSYLFIFLVFLFIGIWPILFYNQLIYGNALFTGYFEVNNLLSGSSTITSRIIQFFSLGFAPFGFDLLNIIKTSFYYLIAIFFWWLIPLIIGLTFFISRITSSTRAQKLYFWIYIIISFLLIIYYGSWQFNDHPDPRAISIGTSFTRYWLPIYIMSLPFIASAIIKIGDLPLLITKKKSSWISTIIISIIIIFLGISSSNLVLWGTDESLVAVISNIQKSNLDANIIINITEEKSLIIVDDDDKNLFPNRSVMVPFRSDFNLNAIPDLIKVIPIYYFGLTLPEVDINYLNTKKLFERNLKIETFREIRSKTLYKISPL